MARTMDNSLATIPTAELLRHKMRAAWPVSPVCRGLGPGLEVLAKIRASKSILGIEDKRAQEFTGDEISF